MELTSAQINKSCFSDIPAHRGMGCLFRRVTVDRGGRERVPDYASEQWLATDREHSQPTARLDHIGGEAMMRSKTIRPLWRRSACCETYRLGVDIR